jgi:hypothetical protein
VAPYVGLGWGRAVRRQGRLGLLVDLGTILQGTPRVSLAADGVAAADAAFRQALERERAELADRLRAWRVFPVVALTLSYRLR